MLPCHGCAYRREIPGDCHSRCVFDWINNAAIAMPKNTSSNPRHTNRWFAFPFNYDPVWGPDECAARAETQDNSKVAQPHPFLEILSLLGGR